MDKNAFLDELREKLSGLPEEDIEERVAFYREMIDDRIEDGVPEEEAVEGVGTVDSVVEQIMSEIPLSKLVREKVKPKRSLKAWEIVLLVLGSTVWIPLLVAAAAVVFAVYIVIWAVVICVCSGSFTGSRRHRRDGRHIHIPESWESGRGCVFCRSRARVCRACDPDVFCLRGDHKSCREADRQNAYENENFICGKGCVKR